MVNKVNNKFSLVFEFSSSSWECEQIFRSKTFLIGGCQWYLCAHHKGKYVDDVSLSLKVFEYDELPSGWKKQALFRLSIINQKSNERFQLQVERHWFDQKYPNWDFTTLLPLSELNANDGGFLMNGHVKFVAEVDVLEVKDEEESRKRIKLEDEAVISELVVLPSQKEFMRRLFQKHPDVAIKIRSKNPHLSRGYMNVLFSLTQKLCKSPRELSNDDISDVGAALVDMEEAGFKLNWLEKKLDEVKEKKKKEEACLAELQVMDEELKPLEQKFFDLKAQMDKKKGEILEAQTPISFDL